MADSAIVAVHQAAKRLTLPSGSQLDILREVSFEAADGESIAVRGRSGSGKTTLLRALGLLTPFDTGAHHLLGTDVRAAGDRRCSRLRAQAIGFVFQDFRLLPRLTATQNVEYGCILAGIGRQARRKATREALHRVGLSERLQSRPGHLSGGEQQRVAIARALVKKPKLVLADEPTGSLDSHTADVVMELLLQATAELGAALVLVTHDDNMAKQCGRQVELVDGTIREEP